MTSTPAPKRTNGWTPERRLKQSQSIRRWSPWQKSTGPRTEAGKKRIALNALKHGRRAAVCAQDRAVKDYLRLQARFVTQVETMIRVAKALDKAGIPCTHTAVWHMLYGTKKEKTPTSKLMDSPLSRHPGAGRDLPTNDENIPACAGMTTRFNPVRPHRPPHPFLLPVDLPLQTRHQFLL